jgi:type VI secretion system protein ImpA
MADFASLLEPISPESPSGANLYYDKTFDDIKEARRQEDTAPQDMWEREVKMADYNRVATLIETAFTTKTKDLRLAVWLVEACIYREGTVGLVSGIQFLIALLEKFWPSVHPEIDDGDLEDRFSPLEWFGTYLDPSKGSSPRLALCRIPVVKGKFDFFAYQESRRTIVFQAPSKEVEQAKRDHADAVVKQKILAEAFDKVFDETPKALYKKLNADYKDALTALEQLDTFCRAQFTQNPPSFGPLRKTIEEIANAVSILLKRKLEKDPDPIAQIAPPEPGEGGEDGAAAQPGSTAQSAIIDLSQFGGGAINSLDQAQLHVLAAAQYLRRNIPASPLPYLLLRALRWGEVRQAGDINPSDLIAPSGEIRVALRNAAGAANWPLVLDIAETAMSNLTGRGWLDLQRYSVKACDELGYAVAARALRSELKCFLADFPQLPKAILNDDTGAANPETLAWLESEGLLAR